MALLGLCIVWVNVGALTLIQRRTPADLLGRVDAALMIAVTVPQTASIALGAALVAVVDYRLLLAVMAAVLVISVVYLMGGPGAWHRRGRPRWRCETGGPDDEGRP